MSNEEIEQLLPWGPQQEIQTKRGPRLVRKARETKEFAEFWKAHQEELYAAGVSRWKADGAKYYTVSWWKEIPPEVILARQKSVQESSAVDADIAIPAPPGLEYLPYQKAGVRFASQRDGTLIGDEMGLGKTIQAIGLINLVPQIHRVLVIVPAHLKLKWFRELKKWLVRPQSVGIADGSCFPSTDIVIINFQILDRFPKKLEFYWDLVVIDEGHELRNPKAMRTKLVFGYRPNRKERENAENPNATAKQRLAAVEYAPIPTRRRLILSGTPMANEPAELFPLLNYLDSKSWPNRWLYEKRYCGLVPGRGYVGKPSNLGELQERLRATVMIRRLKRDVLKELPEKRREVIEFPAARAMEVQAENAALRDFMTSLARMRARVEIEKASGDHERYKQAVDDLLKGTHAAQGEMAQVRKQTAMAKIPLVIEHIKPLIDEGNKIILFAFHREVVLAYHEAFTGSVMVRGGMTDSEKMRAVDTFQRNEACKLISCNMDAAGTGYDMTSGNLVFFAEEEWVPYKVSQCEDRAHRIGQLNSVFVQHGVLEGSVDCRMAYTMIAKQAVIEKTLDTTAAEAMKREPLIPMPEGVTVSMAEFRVEAARITGRQLAAMNRAVQMLAAEAGRMNLVDAQIAGAMAGFLSLTQMQGVLAGKLIGHYRGLLPLDLVTECVGDIPASAGPSAIAPTPPDKAKPKIVRERIPDNVAQGDVFEGEQMALL